MRVIPVISALLLVLVIAASAFAQVSTQLNISDQRTLTLKINSTKPLPREFIERSAKDVSAYRLYEVEVPDPDKPCAFERCIRPLDDFLNSAACDNQDCQQITLKLANNVPARGSFLLVVRDLEAAGKSTRVVFNPIATAEIISPWSAYDIGREFRVKSNVPLQSTPTVNVTRTVIRLTPDSLNVVDVTQQLAATLVDPTPMPFFHSYRFKKKLAEGNEYEFKISSGLQDPNGQNVTATGKLKIPGASAPPDDPKISINLASSSAAKQKSVLDFTLGYKPLRNVQAFTAFGRPVYFAPEINADLGLRSTKSNNSVTVYLPFTENFPLDEPYDCLPTLKDPNACQAFTTSKIPRFARWSRTPWHRFAATKLYLGPKFEFDRSFHRTNVLGSLRLDFLLYRLLGSIAYKRGLIAGNIGEQKAATLEGINTGFKLTPYLSFDFGGHANNETVEKELSNGQTASLIVPRHKILRAYVGFNGTIEWRLLVPMTITLDEAVVYLGARETIGLTTDTGVETRQVRGFHPHFKTQWDIAFDSSKHYSFNVTYENGRLAPNFEYLNKLTAGIKVQY